MSLEWEISTEYKGCGLGCEVESNKYFEMTNLASFVTEKTAWTPGDLLKLQENLAYSLKHIGFTLRPECILCNFLIKM